MPKLKAKPIVSGLALAIIVAVAFGAFAAGRSSTGSSPEADASSQQTTSTVASPAVDLATDDPSEGQTAAPAVADTATPQGVTVGTVAPRPEIPVTVTVNSPTSGLASGDVIDVRVTPDAGSQIYGVEARVCAGGASIDLPADFVPTQIGLCALHALAPGANDHVSLQVPPPYAIAEFGFRVGTGTDEFATAATLGGRPVSITCDRDHPCQLVLKLQVPDDVRFHSIPLTFA
jgi:hypothetical protein